MKHTELLLLTALEHEGTDEDALCRLMCLLHQQGRRHEALRFYQRTVDALHEELGTRPIYVYAQELAAQIREEPVVFEKHSSIITRREAITTIAGLVEPPILYCCSPAITLCNRRVEDLLPQCATALTECWHAMKGNGLTHTEQDITCLSFPSNIARAAAFISHHAHVAALLSRAHQTRKPCRPSSQ